MIAAQQNAEAIDKEAKETKRDRNMELATLTFNDDTGVASGGPAFLCFEWLAQEATWEKWRFDCPLAASNFKKIDTIKIEFDEIDRLTIVINKRESLLGIPKTKFGELKVVQDELKPLYDLWNVAQAFGKTMPIWVEGSFEDLDAADIEQTLEEWSTELKRL